MRKNETIRVGDYIYIHGEAMLIINVSFPLGRIDLLGKHDEKKSIDIVCFFNRIAKGEIEVRSLPIEKSSRAWSSKEIEEATYRMDLLNFIAVIEEKSICKVEVQQLLVEFCKNRNRKKEPSSKTISSYKKAFNANGFDGLIPDFSKRGGSGWSKKKESKELAEVFINSHYLQDDKVNLANLSRVVQNALRKNPENPLPGLDRKTITRMVLKLPRSSLKGRRLDPRTYNLWNRQAVKTFTVNHAFELMQIDATTISVYCIDEVGNTFTELTLYTMICTYTNYPVALYVTAGKPSEHTLLKLFEFLFTPKDNEFHERFGLQTRWVPPCGISAVLLDNASENAAGLSLDIVRELGIDVHYARSHRGDDKPHVESSFSTLKKKLLNFLPGSQVSAEAAEKNRHKKAEKEACYSAEDIYKELVAYVGDVYIHEPKMELGFRYAKASTIHTAMQEELNSFMPPPPPSQETVKHLILNKHRVTRKVHHYGVEFSGFTYHSQEFARYTSEYNIEQIEVMYNPSDCRAIYAVKPEDDSLIELKVRMKDMPAISFDTAKLLRKAYGKTPDSMEGHDYQSINAETLLKFSSDSKSGSKKVKERNKVRREVERQKTYNELGRMLADKIPSKSQQQTSEPIIPDDDDDEISPAPRRDMPR